MSYYMSWTAVKPAHYNISGSCYTKVCGIIPRKARASITGISGIIILRKVRVGCARKRVKVKTYRLGLLNLVSYSKWRQAAPDLVSTGGDKLE